jgi:hypothetical protein
VLAKGKLLVPQQVSDIFTIACDEIIQADDFMALGKKTVT